MNEQKTVPNNINIRVLQRFMSEDELMEFGKRYQAAKKTRGAGSVLVSLPPSEQEMEIARFAAANSLIAAAKKYNTTSAKMQGVLRKVALYQFRVSERPKE